VKAIIDGLSNQGSGFMIASQLKPDGTTEHFSEAQVTAVVLKEFYEKTQVMIGEAISASELVAFLKEQAAELPKMDAKNGAGR
jgi:hypothetical protein